VVLGERIGLIEQLESNAPRAAFEPIPSAGAVDQDTVHGRGGGREEMPRPSNSWSPTKRRYASCTSAVAFGAGGFARFGQRQLQ
jgi:hypothetical protein